MVQSEIYQNKNAGSSTGAISLCCITLCGVFFVVLGCLPIFPEQLTKFLRPAFIAVAIVFAGKFSYPLGAAKWQLVSLVYYTCIFFAHDITTNAINVYFSLILFILFFVFASCRVWNKREIILILTVAVIACDVESIVMAIFNNGVLGYARVRMSYAGATINRNTFAFTVVPGCLASMILLMYSRNRGIKRIFYFISFFLCAFMVFAAGCRSAFYSTVAGLLLISHQRIQEDRSYQQRFYKKLLLMVFILFVAYVLFSVAGDNYSSRIFNVTDTNSRDKFWEQAQVLINQKPVFGGGYDYWLNYGNGHGTHNSFVLTMLYSGYVGLAFVVVFLAKTVLDCVKCKNYVALAFFIEALFHSYTETSFDYYAYIPIILTYILLKCTQYENKPVSAIFS